MRLREVASKRVLGATFFTAVLVLPIFLSVISHQLVEGAVSRQEYGSMASNTNWPMFRHDPGHTGYSFSSAPTTNNTLWTYGTEGEVRSSPAAVDGMVFVGSNDTFVYALRERTGELIWKYITGGPVWSSPAVVDGTVYVGSMDGMVYALDQLTGDPLWSHPTEGSIDSSPAVVGGLVFVGSSDGHVYALDQFTGDPMWTYKTDGAVHSSPAVADLMVFVGSFDKRVYALDQLTGDPLWSHPTEGSIDSSPAVVGGLVFVGSSDGHVYALDQFTGDPMWTYKTDGAVHSSPAVADGMVFVGSGDYMYALDQFTGEQIWSYPTGLIMRSSPAVADGLVFVGSWGSNKLYALNETSGKPVWSFTTGGGVDSSPAVADGHVVVGSGDGKVYKFGRPIPLGPWPMFRHDPRHTGYSNATAPATNDTRWLFNAGGPVWSSPAVADGMVFVSARLNWSTGKIYALNESNGLPIWSRTMLELVTESSPAVAHGKVFIGSKDGKVYALNETTGALIWSRQPGGEIRSSPVVADHFVYVGSSDGTVRAYEHTGATKWVYPIPVPPGSSTMVLSSPAVANDTVFVGSTDGQVHAIDALTGVKKWNYTTGGGVVSSPAVVNGKVFVGSYDRHVYALDETTGTQVWNYTTGNAVWSSPAVAYGKVFVGSLDYHVYALDETTGTQVWNYTTGHWVYSSPAVADGKVYVGSYDNKFYALNATNGTRIWSYRTGHGVFSSPAVANGSVFVGSDDNFVYGFSPALISPSVLYEEETEIGFKVELARWNLTRNTPQNPWLVLNQSTVQIPPFLTYGGFAGVTLDDIRVLVDVGFNLTADVPISVVTVTPEAVPKNSSFNFMIKLAQKPTSLEAKFWLNLSISLSGSYNWTTIVENITNTPGFPQNLTFVLDNLTALGEAMANLADFLRVQDFQRVDDWIIQNATQMISDIRSLINDIVGYVNRSYTIHLGYGRISKDIEFNPWQKIEEILNIDLDQYINNAYDYLSQVESLLNSIATAVGEIEDLVDALLALVAGFPATSFNFMLKVIDFSKTLNGTETLYGNFSLPLGDFVFDLRHDLPSFISDKIKDWTHVMYIQTLMATPITVDALFDIGLIPQLSVSTWIEGNTAASGASITNPSFTLKNYSDYANIQAHSHLTQTQPINLSIYDLSYNINASFSLIPFIDLYLQVPYLTIPLFNLVDLLPPSLKPQLVLPIAQKSFQIPGTVNRTVMVLTEFQGNASGFTISERTFNKTIEFVDWNVKNDTLSNPFFSFDRSFFGYPWYVLPPFGLNLSGAFLLDAGLNVNFSLPLRFRQIVPNLGVPRKAFTISTQLVPTDPEIQVHFWLDLDLSLNTSWNLETILQNIIYCAVCNYTSDTQNVASDLFNIVKNLTQALSHLSNVTSWSTSTLISALDNVSRVLDDFKGVFDSFTFSGEVKIWGFTLRFSFNFLDRLRIGGISLRTLVSEGILSIDSFIEDLQVGITAADSVVQKVIDLLDGVANFVMNGSIQNRTLNLLSIDFNETFPLTHVYDHPLWLPMGNHSYDLRVDLPRDVVVTTNRTKLVIDALTHFLVSFSIIPAPVTVDLIADVDFTPILKALGYITGTVTASPNTLFETKTGPQPSVNYVLDEYDKAKWFKGMLDPTATSNFDFNFTNFQYTLEATIEIIPSVELLLDIPLVPFPIPIVNLFDLIPPPQLSFSLGTIIVSWPSESFKETIPKAPS